MRIAIGYDVWRVTQWQKILLCQEVENYFETFDVTAFSQALGQVKVKRFQAYELILTRDFCTVMTIMLDAEWQHRVKTLAFMDEVRAEITHEIEAPEDYFIDAHPLQSGPEGLEVEVLLVSKLKINAYLKACQAKHLRLKAIYIEDEMASGLNLFPWREKQLQDHQQAFYFRIFLLPALVFLIAFLGLYYENGILVHQQKIALRLQKQAEKYTEENPNAFNLGDALPLLHHLNEVDQLKIDVEGEVTVSGMALKSEAVSPQIQALSDNAALEKNSLHDVKIR